MYLTALALIPGILIVIYIFRKDKVEREPVGLLVKLVAFGAISCIPAAALETAVDGYISMFQEGSLAYALLMSFASAALMEENCKYLLLRLGSWRNKEFDYRFDGVVYGVCVACGFAMLENVLYVFEGGVEVALTRAFISVPLHAFCGAFMGAFYGMAKLKSVKGDGAGAFSCHIAAIVVPIIIHGIFDTICFVDWEYSTIVLLVYTGILYIIGIRMINRLESEDVSMGFYEDRAGAFEYVPVNNEVIRGSNSLSRASLVCGIISFISMSSAILPSVLAIIFGIRGKAGTGKGVKNTAANAGIFLGVASLLLNIYLVAAGGYY